jgi:hypothetical protein
MPEPSIKSGRVQGFLTAAVVSFSLTLLAAGIAVLSGLAPLHAASSGQRVDIGALLLVVPLVALVLAMAIEVARIALRGTELPQAPPRALPARSPAHPEG